jgi:hypothetical protein
MVPSTDAAATAADNALDYVLVNDVSIIDSKTVPKLDLLLLNVVFHAFDPLSSRL